MYNNVFFFLFKLVQKLLYHVTQSQQLLICVCLIYDKCIFFLINVIFILINRYTQFCTQSVYLVYLVVNKYELFVSVLLGNTIQDYLPQQPKVLMYAIFKLFQLQ
jgi:hypothetical protein